MTAAERFVKRMLGGISSSQYMGNGEGGGTGSELPESQDIVKHDEHYHPDGYNPQTDDCSLRDGIETKLTESVDADILEGKKEKPTVQPTENPIAKTTETPQEQPKEPESLRARVEKLYKEYSGGEELPPWVDGLDEKRMGSFFSMLRAGLDGKGYATSALEHFEEACNNRYIHTDESRSKLVKEVDSLPSFLSAYDKGEIKVNDIVNRLVSLWSKDSSAFPRGRPTRESIEGILGGYYAGLYTRMPEMERVNRAGQMYRQFKLVGMENTDLGKHLKMIADGALVAAKLYKSEMAELDTAIDKAIREFDKGKVDEELEKEKAREREKEEAAKKEREKSGVKDAFSFQSLSDILARVEGEKNHADRSNARNEKEAAIAEYLQNGDIEVSISGKKSEEVQTEGEIEDEKKAAEEDKELQELEARLNPIRENVRRKDYNALMRNINKVSPPIDFEDSDNYVITSFGSSIDRILSDLVLAKYDVNIFSEMDQAKAKSILGNLEKHGVEIPPAAKDMLSNIADGSFFRMFELRRKKKNREEAKAREAKEKEKEESKKREIIRQAKKEHEYQEQRVIKGLGATESGAKALGLPNWIYNLLNSRHNLKQRLSKEKKAEQLQRGEGISIDMSRDVYQTGDMIFGECPRWFTALSKMRGFLYRAKDAYAYSMTGTRTHTMRFQGFSPTLRVRKGKVTLGLTPHSMVTDGWFDTTDSENKFVSVLRDSRIDAKLGLNGAVEVAIDEYGSPEISKPLRIRDFTEKDKLLSDKEVGEIVSGDKPAENPLVFIDSVYRGGGEEYPEEAKGMAANDTIPITDEFYRKKLADFFRTTKSVIQRFPQYSKIMGKIRAAICEFADGYVSGEVLCAKFKDGRDISPLLRFSGVRRISKQRSMPTKERIQADTDKDGKCYWKCPNVASSYALSDQEYFDMILVHELGHVYYDRAANQNSWVEAVKSTEAKDIGKERRKIENDAKLSIRQFPWIGKVSDYARTNINELHSECLAMCSCTNYEKGILPKAIEDYCFAVLNGNFEKAEK